MVGLFCWYKQPSPSCLTNVYPFPSSESLLSNCTVRGDLSGSAPIRSAKPPQVDELTMVALACSISAGKQIIFAILLISTLGIDGNLSFPLSPHSRQSQLACLPQGCHALTSVSDSCLSQPDYFSTLGIDGNLSFPSSPHSRPSMLSLLCQTPA